MDMNAGGLIGLLIFIIIVFAVAWLIIWAVQQFLPELYPPARIIVGVIALIAILIRVAAYLRRGRRRSPMDARRFWVAWGSRSQSCCWYLWQQP